jgi:diguanylate cyclase (GGDEF)-like protein/PAS domain S-box-containing protein
MTLRNRLLWLFTPLLALTLAIIYGLSESLLLSRFDRQDQQSLLAEAEQLHLHLDSELRRHQNMLRSYAWWDGSYEFAQNPTPNFVRQHLEMDVLINLAFDFMLYFDNQDQLIGELWAPPDPEALPSLDSTQPPSSERLHSAIILRAMRLGALEHDGDPQHTLAQLAVVQGVPLLLVSSPISNSRGTAPPVGTILAGHILDKMRLAQLQERVQGNLRLLESSPKAVSWSYLEPRQPELGISVQISPRNLLSEELQQIDLLFRNSNGEPELHVQIDKQRLSYLEGETTIHFFLAAALLVGVSAMLLIYLGLERWILRRVQRLNEEIATIGIDGQLPRMSDLGDDELGRLASELNRMLERLEQSEERDRLILDTIEDGYFEIDRQGVLRTANRALGRLFGLLPEQMIGRSYKEVLSAEDAERARKMFLQVDREAGASTFSAPFKRDDGSVGYFETRLSSIEDAHGRFAGYRGILRDISEQVSYQNRLLEMAYRDALTDLGNRKAFLEHLQKDMELAQREHSELALLYLDLDRFKEVNDRFGHDIGDALLVAIAARLRATLRDPNRLYRLGGDEFTLLVPDASREAAKTLAERLLATLDEPFMLAGQTVDFVTPSIGIALFPNDANDAENLIKAADSAMYQAKLQRNRACFYQPVLFPESQSR